MMNHNYNNNNEFVNVSDPYNEQHEMQELSYVDDMSYFPSEEPIVPLEQPTATTTIIPPPVPQHLLIQKRQPYMITNHFQSLQLDSYSPVDTTPTKQGFASQPIQFQDENLTEYIVNDDNEELISQEQDGSLVSYDNLVSDPTSSKFFPVRWWKGFCFPMKALYMCFKAGYIWITLCESLVIGLVLLATFAAGCVCGFFTLRAIWKIPSDRAWHFLWKFIPYNFMFLWVLTCIACCMFYSGIMFAIGFIPFRALIDTSCKRLSLVAERRMKLDEMKPKSQQKSSSTSLPQIDMDTIPYLFTTEWFIDCGKSYIDGLMNGFVNQCRSTVRRTAKRLLIRMVSFVIMNVVGAVLGVLIPGIGIILSLITFIITSSLNTALIGLDVVFDRKEYRLLEAQRTIWNNFWLIVGHGSGLLVVSILPGGVFLMLPVSIIASTRLITQLELHGKTGKSDEFWDFPILPLSISFHYKNPNYVRVISSSQRAELSLQEPDLVDMVL